jgi:conjugative relaxase-like TrwC/TraI family protein
MDLGDYLREGDRAQLVWAGKGAEQLRLRGQCREEDFASVCQAEAPSTGIRLAARETAGRRICFFAQVSAPKDVSLLHLVAGDARIAGWWKESVDETLREIEAVTATRVRKAGACEDRTTGSFTAAVVTHEASRSLDPQLHTHVAIMNLTFDAEEQRWKGVQPSGYFRHQGFFREVCYNALARRLTAAGYQLEAGRGIGFQVAGVPAELRQRFSKRRQTILSRAKELGAQSQDALQAIASSTREAKVRLGVEALRRRWQEEAGELLTPLREVVRQAEKRVDVGIDRSAGSTIEAAAAHLFERRTVVDERVLLREALIAGRGRVDLSALRAAVRFKESQGELVRKGEEIASREALQTEQDVLGWVRTPGTHGPLGRAPDLSGLGDDQAAAVRGVLASNGRTVILQGDAGTGKTTALRSVIAGITDAPVRVFAPSSGAVEVLRKEVPAPAETVQQLLANPTLQRSVAGAVLLVDEAGLLSVRELHRLMRVADEQGARLLLVGDTKQHASVEAGDALRCLLEHSDVPRFRLSKIRRQRDPRYRDAVRLLARGDAAEALDRFAALGAVREIRETKELLTEAASAYVRVRGEGRTCLAISPVWAEIHPFHDAVRGRLRQAGGLRGDDVSRETIYPLKWTKEEKRRPVNYEVGDRLTFFRGFEAFRKDDCLRVVGVADDALVVESEDGRSHRLDPRFVDGFEVGVGRTLGFAVGETLRLRANLRDARLNNGDLVELAGFRPDGGLTLTDGRVIPPWYRHFGYGYGSTSHGAQGKTVDCGILILGAQGLAAANLKQAYVSNSRFRDEQLIFTTDFALARQRMGRSDDRQLAVEWLPPVIRPRPPSPRQGFGIGGGM